MRVFTQRECSDLRIDLMTVGDLTQVMKIEKLSFEYPWGREAFLYYIHDMRYHECTVARYRETVLGFVVHDRFGYKIHILNFVVHPAYRRRGVGTRIIQSVIDKLSEMRRSISLEVIETNLVAQFFFQDRGFGATQILHRFWEDTGEDAYLMQYPFSKGAVNYTDSSA